MRGGFHAELEFFSVVLCPIYFVVPLWQDLWILLLFFVVFEMPGKTEFSRHLSNASAGKSAAGCCTIWFKFLNSISRIHPALFGPCSCSSFMSQHWWMQGCQSIWINILVLICLEYALNIISDVMVLSGVISHWLSLGVYWALCWKEASSTKASNFEPIDNK